LRVLLVSSAVIFAAGAVWGTAIHTLTTPKPVPVKLRPEAIAWGDRVFADRKQLAVWLRARGHSYSTWERRHPAGVRILAPRPR
jgi:hypothetical protein